MIKIKEAVEVFLAVSILIGFSSPIFCQTIKTSITITEVTGLLRVTKPDGTKMDILPSDVPLQIPADCEVETIKGTAKMEVHLSSSTPKFKLSLTVFLTPHSSAKISFDKSTGKILTRGLKGIVKVFEKGRRVTLKEGEELVVGGHVPLIRREPPEPEPIEGSPYLP